MKAGSSAAGWEAGSGCAGKQAFRCAAEAHAQVARSLKKRGSKPGEKLVTYSCPDCSNWHLGRQKEKFR